MPVPVSLDTRFDQLMISAAGCVSSITVGAGGTGYTNAPTVAIAAPPAGGRQAQAIATVAAGAVTGFIITDPGEGYVSVPAVTLTPNGGGSGASATAVMLLPNAANRFQFACFVTSFTPTETRSTETMEMRDCDSPSTPAVTVRLPGTYAMTVSLSGASAETHVMFQRMEKAVRAGVRLEFMRRIELPAAQGGGADTFFGYVTNFATTAPVKGFVTFTATVEVDGVPTWTQAAA